jgi:hypothetical protein
MHESVESQPSPGLTAQAASTGGLDSVDGCRMRLVSLRTRIETNWPAAGGRFFNRGQSLHPENRADISELLVGLPTPLPLVAGGEPETVFCDDDTDLMEIAGRAVDAGFALLEGATLETVYQGDVSMLESRRPEALEPIVVSRPTVGLLVATIIGTLEAISEIIADPASRPADVRAARVRAAAIAEARALAAPPEPPLSRQGSRAGSAKPQRGPIVPRI